MIKERLLATSVLFGLLLTTINACGMIVHMDVTERAINSFFSNSTYPYEQVLKKYHSYAQAGSPFPDWGYVCKSDAGEAGHWPPFIEAYIAYMDKTYQKGTDEYNKLLAFLFGISSHIEADIIWHWG